jgi:hypothetical protein
VSIDTNRKLAAAARALAAATTLPNVRERELRSAEAYEAMADRAERVAEGKPPSDGKAARAAKRARLDDEE